VLFLWFSAFLRRLTPTGLKISSDTLNFDVYNTFFTFAALNVPYLTRDVHSMRMGAPESMPSEKVRSGNRIEIAHVRGRIKIVAIVGFSDTGSEGTLRGPDIVKLRSSRLRRPWVMGDCGVRVKRKRLWWTVNTQLPNVLHKKLKEETNLSVLTKSHPSNSKNVADFFVTVHIS